MTEQYYASTYPTATRVYGALYDDAVTARDKYAEDYPEEDKIYVYKVTLSVSYTKAGWLGVDHEPVEW